MVNKLIKYTYNYIEKNKIKKYLKECNYTYNYVKTVD